MTPTVEEARQSIVRHLQQNPTETFTTVAQHFGCTVSTISRIAKANGITPPRLSRIRFRVGFTEANDAN